MNRTIVRLAEALNRHDPDGMAALMTADYRSEQPAHPNRSSGGNDQVAANWARDVPRRPRHGGGGGRRDHGRDDVVVRVGLADDGRIRFARLYMEPVELGGGAIDEAVEQLSTGGG